MHISSLSFACGGRDLLVGKVKKVGFLKRGVDAVAVVGEATPAAARGRGRGRGDQRVCVFGVVRPAAGIFGYAMGWDGMGMGCEDSDPGEGGIEGRGFLIVESVVGGSFAGGFG